MSGSANPSLKTLAAVQPPGDDATYRRSLRTPGLNALASSQARDRAGSSLLTGDSATQHDESEGDQWPPAMSLSV